MHLTIFDIGVLIVIFFSVALGMMRRLSGEILNVLAWVLAIICTFSFADALASSWLFKTGILEPFFSSRWIRVLSACILIFFTTYLSIRFVFYRLCRLFFKLFLPFEGRVLPTLDRVLGGAYGLGRGVLFSSLVYWLIIWIMPMPETWPQWVASSRMRPVLALTQTYLEMGVDKLKQTAVSQAIFPSFFSGLDADMEKAAAKVRVSQSSRQREEAKKETGNAVLQQKPPVSEGVKET